MDPMLHIDIAKERMAMYRGEHSKAARWQPWSTPEFFNIFRRFSNSLLNWATWQQVAQKQTRHKTSKRGS